MGETFGTFTRFVRQHWKIALSVTFVLIATIDTFVTSISTIAATFLGLAALPWLLGLFEKITLPGGIELNLRELEQRLDENKAVIHDADREAFEFLKTNDPNLAMAALRIEIEKRLRKIAHSRRLTSDSARKGIPQLLEMLKNEGAVGGEVVSMILDMLPAMNAAAHGVELPTTSDEWVSRNGPKLLSLLDEKS
jgi:hypothetical protein